MLVFSSFVALIVCTRHSRGLQRWLDIFARLFGNYSVKFGRGGWLNSKTGLPEGEANLTFEVWGVDLEGALKLVRLGRHFQAAEGQDAVSIVWQHPSTGWQARIVFTQADWEDLKAEVAAVFSEEPVAV